MPNIYGSVETLINKLKTIDDFSIDPENPYERVQWGFIFPDEVGLENFPVCFVWGGSLDVLEHINLQFNWQENLQISIYVMNYNDESQTEGIKKLNELEYKIVDTIRKSGIAKIPGFKIDRDTTFIKIGGMFNMHPPYFCSRIDLTLTRR